MSTIKTTTLSTQGGSTVPVDTVVNGTAKAWVNFNGTSTVAIRRAFNVSSITDNGTGDYTVNFTTAMPNANYSAVTGTYHAYNGTVWNSIIRNSIVMGMATSSCRVGTGYSYASGNAAEDPEYVYVSIFS